MPQIWSWLVKKSLGDSYLVYLDWVMTVWVSFERLLLLIVLIYGD